MEKKLFSYCLMHFENVALHICTAASAKHGLPPLTDIYDGFLQLHVEGGDTAAVKRDAEAALLAHFKSPLYLVEKPFFPSLLGYMLSGPVTCMVWEGTNAVKMGRQMLGATNPQDSLPGTIRGDFCIEVGRNICHGSDSVENAEKEIALWFKEGVVDWESHSLDWFHEER